MSKTETQLKSKLVSVGLISEYESLLEKVSKGLPKIERDLVVGMLMYQTKYPGKTPWVRLEMTYKPSIKPTVKKEELFKKTGRSAEIRHGHVFVIDPYITLQKLEELARDEDVEYIEGTITP